MRTTCGRFEGSCVLSDAAPRRQRTVLLQRDWRMAQGEGCGRNAAKRGELSDRPSRVLGATVWRERRDGSAHATQQRQAPPPGAPRGNAKPCSTAGAPLLPLR
jgi:hypothetical protein